MRQLDILAGHHNYDYHTVEVSIQCRYLTSRLGTCIYGRRYSVIQSSAVRST